jgi:hypothetical protein
MRALILVEEHPIRDRGEHFAGRAIGEAGGRPGLRDGSRRRSRLRYGRPGGRSGHDTHDLAAGKVLAHALVSSWADLTSADLT